MRARFEERARQAHEPAQHAAQAHALEAAHLHELQREAGRRDQLGLEAARRADEHRLAARVAAHLLGDRDARDRDVRRCRRPRSAPAAARVLTPSAAIVGWRGGSGARGRWPTSTMSRGPASVRLLAPLSARRRMPGNTQSPRLGIARRDVREHAGREQAHDQRRAAVADERQRQPLGRQRAQHDADVDQRLQPEHRRDAERQVGAEHVARAERRARSRARPARRTAPITNRTPIRPSSSPTMERMKSVCASGRKNSFCRPSPRPRPVTPPEPTLISDSVIW